MSMLKHHGEWLQHDGQSVIIEEQEYQIRISIYTAIYPFPHAAIQVYAERGDRGYDLLNCSDAIFEDVDRQLGGVYK